ncbi:hypothetical protein Mtc_0666 [Methanocella conradii HZ254]|uniref:DUF2029 domain-containing protein n=1 Tax=Methanocella conradii (strain DSM 24694 / JCM 17849 / CGMCC 1.5162 / HZ254) TaxID=1041930 RepID=H8I6W0_METCZ|nr:hypothetical protein [Methanocella conradii]AFC99430.1 hypothetical protein Mtc_0666 [Methanocella conradii HZ254]
MKKALTLYGIAVVAYGALFLALAIVEEVLMRGIWMPFDIASYYGLASSAVPRIYAILGDGAPSSLLLFDTGALSGYRVFIVGIICLACALLTMEMGRRPYGSVAGFLAGLLFTMNMALAQGHLTIGDSLALLFALLSAYSMVWSGKYALSGFLTGLAACFKPLMLLLLPVTMAIMWRKGEMRPAFALIVAAALPLLAVAATAFVLYGNSTLAMAADSGFEAVGFLTDEGYRPPDPLMAVAGIALSACMLTSMFPLALLGFSRSHGLLEEYCLAVGLCFILAIPLKQYLQYWFIALPFLALLCAGAFKAPEKASMDTYAAEKQALSSLAPVIRDR